MTLEHSDKNCERLHALDRLAARALQGDGMTFGERAEIASILTREARHREHGTPSTDALNEKCAAELNESGVQIGDHYIAMREHAERLEHHIGDLYAALGYTADRAEQTGESPMEVIRGLRIAPSSTALTSQMGWKLVPEEATEGMVAAAMGRYKHASDSAALLYKEFHTENYKHDYRAMLAAAPIAPSPHGSAKDV